MNSRVVSLKSGERQEEALLRGLLYCEHCQAHMFPSYGSKAGRRYQYYVCLRAQQRGWKHCPNKSVSAAQIEDGILAQLRAMAAGTSHTGPLEKRLSGFQSQESRRAQLEGRGIEGTRVIVADDEKQFAVPLDPRHSRASRTPQGRHL